MAMENNIISNATMSILSLPNELIHQIIGLLEYKSEIYALSRTCKPLYTLANMVLAPQKPPPEVTSFFLLKMIDLMVDDNVHELTQHLRFNIELPRDESMVEKALYYAVRGAYFPLVKVLLDMYPFLLMASDEKKSLLEDCAEPGSIIHEFLLSRGCFDKVERNPLYFPLTSALEQRSLPAVQDALTKCDINSPLRFDVDQIRSIEVSRQYLTQSATALWFAALLGCTDIVKYLLHVGAQTETPADQLPVIFVAAIHDHSEIVHFLLEVGAYPVLEEISPVHWTLLLEADNDMIKLLLGKLNMDSMRARICDVKFQSKVHLPNLLHFAIILGNKGLIRNLMRSYEAPLMCNMYGFESLSPPQNDNILESIGHLFECVILNQPPSLLVHLSRQAGRKDIELLDKLISKHPEISSVLPKILPSLLVTTVSAKKKSWRFEKIKRLSIEKLRFLQKCHQHLPGATWMELLEASVCDKEATQQMFDLGALEHINQETVMICYQLACENADSQTFDIWLGMLEKFDVKLHSTELVPKTTKYADIHKKYEPWTPFRLALFFCKREKLEILLSSPGVSLTPDDTACQHAFFFRARRGDHQELRLFLERGFDPSTMTYTPDGDYVPLLLWVVRVGMRRGRESLEPLLSHGALVDATDRYGRSALHYAVIRDLEMVKILLSHGADPLLYCNRREGFTTPLHLAVENTCVEPLRLILRALEDRDIELDWLRRLDKPFRQSDPEIYTPWMLARDDETSEQKITKAIRQYHWRMLYPVPNN
jgi:ankyrin repeat protein